MLNQGFSRAGVGEGIANAVLQMYGSVFRGVSDGCYLKDSKVGGRKYAVLNTALAAATIGKSKPDTSTTSFGPKESSMSEFRQDLS